MNKTEILRREENKAKPAVKASCGKSNKQIGVKRKPVSNKKKTKQQQNKKTTKRIRKCSKAQSLPPTHTGSIKPVQKDTARQTKPIFKTMKKKSGMKTKRKITKENNPKKIPTMSRTKQAKRSLSKSLKRKVQSGKVNVAATTKEGPPDEVAGVVFNPATDCVACLEGRTVGRSAG